MKNIITTICLVFSLSLYGQLPDAITFQAIAMDASGEVVTNSDIGLQVSIWYNGPTGTKLYSEEHYVESTDLGHINFDIGRGDAVGGFADNLLEIDWTKGSHYVELEMDASGGTDYKSIGFVELVSVPFALAADISLSGELGPTGPTGITGPAGEKGATGERGTPGWPGPQGPSGGSGSPGPPGTDGAPGATGATGPQGAPGPAGAAGRDGAQGPQGPQGERGTTGQPGSDGPRGNKGEKGVTGSYGSSVIGPEGPQGPKGPDQGEAGPQGQDGPQGYAGLDGATGAKGFPGSNGFGELQLRASAPDFNEERLYVDTGANRADGKAGLRFYDFNLNAWVDLY